MDHHDLFEEARRVTRVRAQQVASNTAPVGEDWSGFAPSRETIHVLPGQVFILMLNDLILGVLAVEQNAIDEAYSLMHAKGGEWGELSQNRRWAEGGSTIHISVHDVR